jgi:hypothetical protein
VLLLDWGSGLVLNTDNGYVLVGDDTLDLKSGLVLNTYVGSVLVGASVLVEERRLNGLCRIRR